MAGMPDDGRYLLRSRLNRRDFVRRTLAFGLATPAMATMLAACGGEDATPPTATAAGPAAQPTPTPQISVNLNTPTTAAQAPPTATATTAAAGGPKRGGSVTFLRTDDADLYDPVLNDANTVIWIMFSVYECLVRSNPTGTGIDPAIADQWEITDDAMTATFHLREGVKFADGSDLTTDDIIFSLERARDTEESAWNFTLAQAKEITAPDDRTIEVELTEPFAPFFAAIAMFNSSIISKAWFEANAVDTDLGAKGIIDKSMGTGPYYIKEWKKDQHTLLLRNEHYWLEGQPYLDEIKISQVPDVNSEILQMQGGEVDGLIGQYSIPYNRVADLRRDPNLQVIISPAAYNYFARVNVAYPKPNPPFDDLHVRKAMAYAINYDSLIQTVQYGIAEPSNSILPRGALYWNPDQESPTFDLERAKAELAESTVPEGFECEVLVTTGNSQQEALATALQAMWKEIGVNLIISPLDNAVVAQRTRDGDFDVRLGGWTNDMIDPDQILSYFVLPESSGNARTGYIDQRSAELVVAARGETDDAKRREMYYEVQERWLDGPLFYLFNIPYIAVVGKHIKGYRQNPLGPWYFLDMYIEE
jgi:peptide/nickel transport system substrate-binding protein